MSRIDNYAAGKSYSEHVGSNNVGDAHTQRMPNLIPADCHLDQHGSVASLLQATWRPGESKCIGVQCTLSTL